MNILFLTLLDFSNINERGIYTDLLREFRRNGHRLFIISPIEKRNKENTHLLKADENVQILKLQIGNIQKTSLIEKGISTITLENKFIKGIQNFFNKVKIDLILYSTPPITFQKAVKYVKKRDNAKTYLLLKDIFPQNAVDIGLFGQYGIKGLIYKYFRHKEVHLYKISDYIGCMSKANLEYIKKKNQYLDEMKIEICPNSIEPINITINESEKKRIREKYKIPMDKVIFIYGGNLGKPQGIDFLIKCLKINEKNLDSFFLIVGSGTETYKLKEYFTKENPKNSKLLNQLQKEDYEILLCSCDVGLIFLDNRFTIPNFPSRILSYMQAAMPVLAATDINTDIGNIIEEGKFGYWCESIEEGMFNDLVNKMCDQRVRMEIGNNARKYLESHYTVKHSYEIVMKNFI